LRGVALSVQSVTCVSWFEGLLCVQVQQQSRRLRPQQAAGRSRWGGGKRWRRL
jgi:hypothetical protein